MRKIIKEKLALALKEAVQVHTSVKAFLSTPYTDNEFRVASLDVSGDYMNGYADSSTIVLDIPLGELLYLINPHKENLNITVVLTIGGIESKRTMLAIIDELPPSLEKVETQDLTREELNREIAGVRFQLLDFSILTLRASSSNGIFRNTTVEQVLAYVFDNDIVDVSSLIDTPPLDLNMVKAHNSRIYESISLGVERRATTIPEFLQSEYGVYRTGINLYKSMFEGIRESKNILHIYPPLDSPKETRLTIHVLDQSMINNAEETYFYKDGIHNILVSASIPIDNDSSKHYVNGINRSVVSPELVTYGKPRVIEPTESLSNDWREIVDKSKGETILQNTLLPFGTTQFTDNQFKLSSEMLKDNLSLLQVNWNYSLIDIIEPGMGCILSLPTTQIHGHIISSHTMIEDRGSKTVLTISMKKKLKPSTDSDNVTESRRVM